MKLTERIKLIFNVALNVIVLVASGFSVNAMAAGTVDITDGANSLQAAGLEPQNGGGLSVPGDMTVTKTEQVMEGLNNPEFYVKQVNQKICEMKFTGTPIDQILRHASSHTTNSIVVKFYSVGQKPLRTTLSAAVAGTATTQTISINVANPNVFGSMDTILVVDANGNYVPGYDKEGNEDKNHGLLLRVLAMGTDGNPIVYALNGQKDSNGKPFKIPALAADTQLIRLGRAAGEKDVQTGSYYSLPEPTEQYCQRYIMQVEQSIYDRLSQKEIPWNFTDIERMAIDDMRIGMEGSGLFGVKSKTLINEKGNVYTSEGIWYRAGKEYTIGTWNADKSVAEISEEQLVDLVNYIIEGAGNGSRTKLFFVDDQLYSALAKIKTEKYRILQGEPNFNNWGLDFESFTSMGTKLLVYRHDLFNAYGMSGCGYILDPNYIDKWVFQNWQRKEFNLRDLFISNGDAVTMEEFSCWTLQFPNAHARVKLATAPDTTTDDNTAGA